MFFRRPARMRAFIDDAGCCERLGHMPGGPIRCDFAAEEKHYAPEGVARIEKSETVHDDGYYRVGTVCIAPDSKR